MEPDGYVVVGTKLDTKQLEAQLKQEQKELERYEKEAEKLTNIKLKIESDAKPIEELKQKLKEVKEERIKMAEELKPIQTAMFEERPSTSMEPTEKWLQLNEEAEGLRTQILDKYQKQEKLEVEISALESGQLKKLEDINKSIEQNITNQSICKDQIQETNNELQKRKSWDTFKSGVKDVGKGIENNIKKVKKWVLAIFGIRSAYLLVRSAMNTLTESDKELKGDINYIKSVIAYTLEPVVKAIVNLVKQLLTNVGLIIRAITGKDIFANTNKGLDKAKKNAKELKKQLAGFDEVNVMSDNKTNNDDTNTQWKLPPTDPEWLETLKKLKDLIIEIGELIGSGVLALKLLEIGKALGIIDGFKFKHLAGLTLIIKGIIDLVESVIAYLNDPSWSNFGDMIIAIGEILLGFAIILGSIPVAIVAIIVIILGVLAKFWDTISGWLEDLSNLIFDSTNGWTDWLIKKLGWLGAVISVPLNTIVGVFTSVIDGIRKLFDGLFGGIKNIIDGIIKMCKGDLWGGLKLIFQGILNMFIGAVNFVIEAINLIISPIRALIVAVAKVFGKNWSMSDVKIPTIPKAKFALATGGIVNNPGKGVDMGSYVAGERGREGIIPLTDPTAMSQLGQEIARYVNINNAVELNIDSRRLGRVMQQSQMNSDFARNV